MKGLAVFAVLTAVLFVLGTPNLVFAATYTIKIPTGAASPDAPYFWQSEKDGDTSGRITINPGDTVIWANADTAAHTVTSGNPEDGPDGLFDSSLFGPGKSFSHIFPEIGNFDYFCIVHPWMQGVVKVVETTTGGAKIWHDVGANVGDGKTTFDVEYVLGRHLDSVSVNTEGKTVNFILAGEIESDELIVMLPEGLIKNPNTVWVDDVQVTDFNSESSQGITTLTIPLGHNSEEVVIMGSAVVPEFGTVSMAILVIGIIGIILVSFKTQKLANVVRLP